MGDDILYTIGGILQPHITDASGPALNLWDGPDGLFHLLQWFIFAGDEGIAPTDISILDQRIRPGLGSVGRVGWSLAKLL